MIEIADFSKADKTNKPSLISDASHFGRVNQKSLSNIPGALFITSNPEEYRILEKINSTDYKLLEEIVDDDGIQRGVSPDLKKAFLVDTETVLQYQLEKAKLKRVLTGGKQVKRYFINYPDLWLIYTSRTDNFSEFPNICAYIDQFKDKITCKEVKQKKHPLYSLHRPRKEHIFLKKQKLLGVITEDEIIVALDDKQTYSTDGLYLFNVREWVNINYLMGILNSKLFVFIYRLLSLEKGRVLAQVKPTLLLKLPIRETDFTNLSEKAQHDRMVELVEQMLNLHKQLTEAKLPQAQTMLKRQIETTDKQIDKLVYELYGLTDEEIQRVEES